ncbi:hypothetical protein [Streptomyces sp. NPDC002491]
MNGEPTPADPRPRTVREATALDRINLGDYVTASTEGVIATTVYGGLETFELSDFLARWTGLHREALIALGKKQRIHPSAFIHPTVIIGDDVIVGPDVKVEPEHPHGLTGPAGHAILEQLVLPRGGSR